MDRLLRPVYWCALLLPAAAVLALVLRYGVNVPYWDQWELVDALAAASDGHLNRDFVFGMHNEHRMPFPKGIMLGLAVLTGWNIRAELLVNILLCLGTLAVVMALMRPALVDFGPWTRIASALAASSLFFSLMQWQNWLWGWQIQWFLAVLAAVSTFAFATWSLEARRPWLHVAAAAAAGLVCQYTIASGGLVWGIALLIFLLHRERRWVVPVWLGLSALVAGGYLAIYVQPPHHPSPMLALGMPREVVIYVGHYLSGPLARNAISGLAIGFTFALLAVAAGFRNRDDLGRIAPWVALGLFAAGSAALTSIGRVGFGTAQALESRYVTIALLVPLALIPLGLLAIGGRGDRRPRYALSAWYAGIAVLIVSTIVQDLRGLNGFRSQHRLLVTGRECILAVDGASDDCLRTMYPNAELVRDRAKRLISSGWSGAPASAIAAAPTIAGADGRRWRVQPNPGAIGFADSAEIGDGVLTAAGWAIHPGGNKSVTRRILIVAGETVVGEAAIDSDRPDVAAHFKKPDFARSGWHLRKEGVALPPGTRLKAYVVLRDDVIAPVGEEIALKPRG